MSDLISAPEARRPRRRHVPRRISMPDGEVMELRRQFAEEELSVCDRTATRMNLPTIYIGGHAYIARNASLRIIADRVQRRNQPAKRRRA
jgi:hypothetical protein